MKILVTGATGFLGHHLCRSLVGRDYQVTALRRSTSDTSLLMGLDLDFAIGDVTDLPSLETAIRGQEAVIHAAALAGASWSSLPAKQNEANIEGTRNIITACIQGDVHRLVFISSVAAIGIPDRGEPPADETFSFNLENGPLNYPVSKRRAEEVVIAGCRNGLDTVIVNPATLFGEWGRRYRGCEWVDKIRHRRVAFYYTGGCNLVHVSDVVDGIISALERGQRGERYILGGENLTYFEISRIVAKHLRQEILLLPIHPVVTGLLAILDPFTSAVSQHPPIARDTHFIASRFQHYSSAKATRELGYSFRSFSNIVEGILNWHDQRSGLIT